MPNTLTGMISPITQDPSKLFPVSERPVTNNNLCNVQKNMSIGTTTTGSLNLQNYSLYNCTFNIVQK